MNEQKQLKFKIKTFLFSEFYFGKTNNLSPFLTEKQIKRKKTNKTNKRT